MPDEPSHRAFLAETLPLLDLVHNLARGMAPDPWGAEDLVQETFLHAYAGFATRRGATRPWLVAICLNLGRSEGRRRARRPERLEADCGLDRAAGEQVDTSATRELERHRIVAAFRRLPAEQRESLLLMDLCGLSAREAAEVLGCPRGTVLARVHRGRPRLARLLDAEGVDHAGG